MVLVVFRSRMRPGADTAAYDATSRRMHELVRQHPGFISIETLTTPDGEEVSLELFESEESVQAWRRHPEHLEAQRRGRAEFYASYRIQRAVIADDRRFEATAQ
jgi:heme-degrading monooxygenase HmoA